MIKIDGKQIWFTSFYFSKFGYLCHFSQYSCWVLSRSSFQFQPHSEYPRFLWVIFCVRIAFQFFQFTHCTFFYLDPTEHSFSAFVHSVIDSWPFRTRGKVLAFTKLFEFGLTIFEGFYLVFRLNLVLTFIRALLQSEDLWSCFWIDSFIQTILSHFLTLLLRVQVLFFLSFYPLPLIWFCLVSKAFNWALSEIDHFLSVWQSHFSLDKKSLQEFIIYFFWILLLYHQALYKWPDDQRNFWKDYMSCLKVHLKCYFFSARTWIYQCKRVMTRP